MVAANYCQCITILWFFKNFAIK